MKKLLLTAMATAVTVVLASSVCFSNAPPLAFGWLDFLLRNVHRVSINPTAVISGIVFIAIAVAAIHGCGASLCRATSPTSRSQRRWHFRWTLTVLAVVVLMFVVGLSTVGLARHLGWLLSSKQPTYEERVSYKVDL